MTADGGLITGALLFGLLCGCCGVVVLLWWCCCGVVVVLLWCCCGVVVVFFCESDSFIF